MASAPEGTASDRLKPMTADPDADGDGVPDGGAEGSPDPTPNVEATAPPVPTPVPTTDPGTGDGGEDGDGDPDDGDPGDGDPGDGDPDGDPGDGDPGNGDPGDGDPGNGDPGNGDSGNGDPDNGDPDDGTGNGGGGGGPNPTATPAPTPTPPPPPISIALGAREYEAGDEATALIQVNAGPGNSYWTRDNVEARFVNVTISGPGLIQPSSLRIRVGGSANVAITLPATEQPGVRNNVTYTATGTGTEQENNTSHAGTDTVAVKPSTARLSLSSVLSSLCAGGGTSRSATELTATLVNGANQPLANRTITLSLPPNAPASLSATTITTNAVGKAYAQITAGDEYGVSAVVSASSNGIQATKSIALERPEGRVTVTPRTPPLEANGESFADLKLELSYKGGPVEGHLIDWRLKRIVPAEGPAIENPGPEHSQYGTLEAGALAPGGGNYYKTFRTGTEPATLTFMAIDWSVYTRNHDQNTVPREDGASSGNANRSSVQALDAAPLRSPAFEGADDQQAAETTRDLYIHMPRGGAGNGSHARILVPSSSGASGYWYGFYCQDPGGGGSSSSSGGGQCTEGDGFVKMGDQPNANWRQRDLWLRLPLTKGQAQNIRARVRASITNHKRYSITSYNCSAWAAEMIAPDVEADMVNVRTPRQLINALRNEGLCEVHEEEN